MKGSLGIGALLVVSHIVCPRCMRAGVLWLALPACAAAFVRTVAAVVT